MLGSVFCVFFCDFDRLPSFVLDLDLGLTVFGNFLIFFVFGGFLDILFSPADFSLLESFVNFLRGYFEMMGG